ncbi:MAG: molybdopterin converting factor subunit 1 [Rhodospirillales bacterium]|nr:molybdopterin converting factor subunit 1 [Rhodospirillales bacterium]MSP81060.1 molybdopterin converting factor subunit 1 [Rhodospirillales bacterium]
MTVRVLYFAYFRERAGRASEDVSPPADIVTVARLIDWLKEKGEGRERAFADPALVRVAVNLEYVKMDHPVRPGDEVAFFPPVTGGRRRRDGNA